MKIDVMPIELRGFLWWMTVKTTADDVTIHLHCDVESLPEALRKYKHHATGSKESLQTSELPPAGD